MRALSAGVVAGILIAEVAVAGGLVWLFYDGGVIVFQEPVGLAAILITASGLILAVATVLIALVSIWGLRDLRDRAAVAARDEVLQYIKTEKFEALVYRAAQEFIRYDAESGVEPDEETENMANALMDEGEDEDN